MTETTAQTTAPMGMFAFLLSLIVRPGRAFRALVEGRTRGWLLVMTLVLGLGIAVVVVSAPVARREIVAQMRSFQSEIIIKTPGNAPRRGPTPTPPPIPPEAIAAATNPLFILVIPLVSMIVGTLVGWLIWAGVLHLLALFFGGRSTFGTMFKTVVAASLPNGIRSLLQAVYIAATQNLVLYRGLSGLVVPKQAHTTADLARQLATLPPTRVLLFHVLANIDLFQFWHLFLLGLGVGMVARFSRRKAYTLVIAVWLVFTLLATVPAFLSYMMMHGITTAGM